MLVGGGNCVAKEFYMLCLKLTCAVALVLCTLIDLNLLRLFVVCSSLCFSYFSFQKKRFKWLLFYLLIAVFYSSTRELKINNDIWILINYFVAMVILSGVFPYYFFNSLVSSYLNKKEYELAERSALKTIEAAGDIFGTRDSAYIKSLTSLADLYFTQNKYQQAEEKYKAVLDLKKYDENNLEISLTLNNLGLTYYNQHNYPEAESCFRKSLKARETYLEENNPLVAEALNNLALPLYSQLRYSESEPLFQRAIAIWENTGDDYELNLATTLNNLAQVYILQEKYTDAEPLLERSLSSKEKILGLHHSDVISSLNNLALLYYLENKTSEADKIIERVLKITDKEESLLHQETLTTINPTNNTLSSDLNEKETDSSVKQETVEEIVDKSVEKSEDKVLVSTYNNEISNTENIKEINEITCISSELDYLFSQTEETSFLSMSNNEDPPIPDNTSCGDTSDKPTQEATSVIQEETNLQEDCLINEDDDLDKSYIEGKVDRGDSKEPQDAKEDFKWPPSSTDFSWPPKKKQAK